MYIGIGQLYNNIGNLNCINQLYNNIGTLTCINLLIPKSPVVQK